MTFFFKAEANNVVGAGHLHRCISIAREIEKRGFQVSFIFSNSNKSEISKIKAIGWDIHQIDSNDELNAEKYLPFIPEGSFLLFDTDDSKFYSGDLIKKLRQRNVVTACYTITDKYPIDTDILINTNVVSATHHYITPAYTTQIIGAKYLIFNQQFRNNNEFHISPSKHKNILLFMGNADEKRLTEALLARLSEAVIDADKITILLGSLNTRKKEIQELLNDFPYNFALVENVANMLALYDNTNLAITSAGMTMWEMALFKIPQLIVASSPREASYASFLDGKKYINLIGNYNKVPTSKELADSITESFNSPNLDLDGFERLLDPDGIVKMVDQFIDKIEEQQ